MRYRELFEGRWWDDSPTITLYHGTSSALLPLIRQHGLQPPQADLREYAFDILRIYVPEAEWDAELIRLVERRAVRAQYGRQGNRGAVLFFKTNRDGVLGYARNYAEDGGEIASDVLISVAQWKGINDLSEIKTRRFPGGKPIIVMVEVPKAWCIIDNDLDRVKANIAKAREEGEDWALGDLAEVYDEVFEDREIRIARTIPPEMIVSIEPVEEFRRIAEAE